MRKRWDVVVVGAGLAGLAAARELVGFDVCVLERDAEAGGRVRTRRRHGVDYELGAVLAYPAALAPADPAPAPAELDPAPMAIHLGGRTVLGEHVAACLDALGVADASSACAAWVRGGSVPADVRRTLDAAFHLIHPAAADDSLLERRVDALRRYPVERRAGGNGGLVERLAPAALLTDVAATTLEDGPTGVRIALHGMPALEAHAAICAVPAPVARDLGIATPVRFAAGSVVVVAVDDVAADAWAYAITPDHACSAVIRHRVPEHGLRLLHAYFVGDAARRLAAGTDDEAIGETLDILRALGATRRDVPCFADVRHWPLVGPVIDEAGYGRRDAGAVQPSPHVVLAGDWTFGHGRTDLPYGMAAAILSGRVAGRRVRRWLDGAHAHEGEHA